MKTWALEWRGADQAFTCAQDGCAEADLVLFFGARGILARPSAFETLRAACPSALIVGCTTGTIIAGDAIEDDGASAVAVKLERSQVRLASVEIAGKTSEAVGAELARMLTDASPAGDGRLAAVLIISDGLNVNGSALVGGLQAGVGASVAIGGGLAADGAAFEKTLVAANGQPRENLVAAIGFYGDGLEARMGVAHGWERFGPPRRITKAAGAVLFEMDGKPALDLYEKYLGDEAAQLPASALLYPLLISNPADESDQVVRTILAVDHEARTMTFAGDMPEGWTAKLMRGAADSLTQGALDAADMVRAEAADASETLALLVSCVGRRLAMGQRTGDEVEAVSEVLGPAARRIGFYSYGEVVTPGVAGHCGLHNQTMTLMTLREAA